ncbi:MAG: hypothetical protein GXY67_11850 [Clostridiales bacterium]|mgnify:CR=1 FL=1|nr:hypothetical protein [Clostridiales bacterium]
MKATLHIKKGLAWFLTFLLALSLTLGAMAESGTIFPWLSYTLDVALVSTDPETVNDPDAPSDGTVVMVKLISPYGMISTEDIDTHSEEIRFRDADGDEYTAYSWRVRGVDYDADKGFSTRPEQEAFEMLYNLDGKTAEAVTGAKLLIPTGVEGETIIVSLDKAPHDGATEQAPEAEEVAANADVSFVLGGIRYTISALEDEPSYVPENFMDGKAGHLVSFSYAGPGKEAEDANDQLYSNARLIQPNGDEVRAYCNSDNIGNPYELFFGLSGDVLLADCVFTLQGDEGEVKIMLSGVGEAGTDMTEEPQTTPAATVEPTAEPAPEPTPEPTEESAEERDANTFAYTVGDETYELALLGVAYDKGEKRMAVEIALYDHELLDFIWDKELHMPFGCGIISTKDGFQYEEGVTASVSTPMHMTFYFDTKNIPDLVCFGKLNQEDRNASEDFALVDPENSQYVDTFPISALLKNEKEPDALLKEGEAADSEPGEDVSPVATAIPSVSVSENADEVERKIVEVLTRCTEGVTDEWQLAIYRTGVQDLRLDPEKEGVYTFRLRGFDPGLKALGKYQAENKRGYLARMLENTRAYGLEVSLTLAEGEFTTKSVKGLQSAVKKAATASQKAFKDQRVLSAVVDDLLYDGFGKGIKKVEDLLSLSPDYLAWISERGSTLSGLNAEQWASFFYGQVKQSLDVTGGPYALKLKCTGVNITQLLENARADALNALAFMLYDQRWEGERVEKELLRALADNVLSMKKKGKEVLPISLSVDGEPFYSSDYEDMLAAYPYNEALENLQEDTQGLPDEAAQEFPKAGWLSGSKSGTKVNVKAPKDSVAYYVQLRNYETDELAVAGFVRPGSTCTLRVPKGNYYFVMASGSTWYGEETLFGEETEFSKTGLFEVKNSNYYHTVTLKVVEGGNMPLYGADEDDLH